jgi:hypothetical protein
MSVNSYADDLSSAVHFALETTHAIVVCPFHLDVTIRTGDDAAETHAVARAKKFVKSDGTAWQGEALRKEFACQLSKAADRYCPHCAMFGDPVATPDNADVNRSRSSSGDDYEKETQFACEGCGDLVELEKAKLRDDTGCLDKDRNAFLNGSLAAAMIIERLSREHRSDPPSEPPWLRGLPTLAKSIHDNRQPLAEDDPYLGAERKLINLITSWQSLRPRPKPHPAFEIDTDQPHARARP